MRWEDDYRTVLSDPSLAGDERALRTVQSSLSRWKSVPVYQELHDLIAARISDPLYSSIRLEVGNANDGGYLGFWFIEDAERVQVCLNYPEPFKTARCRDISRSRYRELWDELEQLQVWVLSSDGSRVHRVHDGSTYFISLYRGDRNHQFATYAPTELWPATAIALIPASLRSPTNQGKAVKVVADWVDEVSKGIFSDSPIYEESYGDYMVRIYRTSSGDGGFLILKNDKVVFRKTGGVFRRGHVYEDAGDTIPIGTDITGDSRPNLVISAWSGAEHCCFSFDVFQIDEDFQALANLFVGYDDGSHFKDLDGDSILEFVTKDWTFAYWKTSFAYSPAPDVFLRFENGQYTLATDLMRKPLPPQKEFQQKTESVRSESWPTEGQPPSSLWGHMLDLIYQGNTEAAWQFFESAWLESQPGKAQFLKEFQEELAGSPYWSEIQAFNGKR